MNMKKINYLYSFIIPILLLIVYFPLLSASRTEDPDAQIILPNLESYVHISDYLKGLVTLKTIDFQPVRDASLYLDLYLFQNFNMNTIITQNYIWWIGCCFTIWSILSFAFQEKEKRLISLLCLIFSTYPLFVPVIGWGMSRKHILSFFFILISTREVIRLERLDLKSGLIISVGYLLSVLSQPINILWPIWSFLYLKIIKNESLKRTISYLTPCFLTLLILGIVNYLYYEFSPVYVLHFQSKTSEALLSADKILAIGHYFFQMFYPFSLSFQYSLGDFQVLVGLAIFSICILLVYKSWSTSRALWLLLGALPILVVLNTPHILSDSYLLVPSFALIALIGNILPKTFSTKIAFFMSIMIVGFGLFSHFESKNWLTPISLTKISFERRPNCRNAINYVRSVYESFAKAPDDAKSFLITNECLKTVDETQYYSLSKVILITSFLFHEDELPIPERVKQLSIFAEKYIVAAMSLAALHIKYQNFVKADETIQKIIRISQTLSISSDNYHSITANMVLPYCQKLEWKECEDIASKYSYRKHTTYYQ